MVSENWITLDRPNGGGETALALALAPWTGVSSGTAVDFKDEATVATGGGTTEGGAGDILTCGGGGGEGITSPPGRTTGRKGAKVGMKGEAAGRA